MIPITVMQVVKVRDQEVLRQLSIRRPGIYFISLTKSLVENSKKCQDIVYQLVF